MTNFSLLQLTGIGAVTLAGATGTTGTAGPTGPYGIGPGGFILDANGDLVPNNNITSSSFFVYDSNTDLMPV